MIVTAWKNGKFGSGRSIALGLAVGRVNRERHFDRKWKDVMIEVGGASVRVGIAGRFWTSCPELRSRAIGDWMKSRGLVPWPERKPPKMKLIHLIENRFGLSL